MTHTTQFQWTSASCSHPGLVRPINEDACLDQPEQGLWVVADGMGGHAFGDYASALVIESLSQMPSVANLEQRADYAQAQLQGVNSQLRAEAEARGVPIIGSTVVALFTCERQCGYMWAGDSRIYLYRDGILRLLTRDHSQLEELKTMASLGAADTMLHPARNLITRAVGATDILELDAEMMEVHDGDMFLLCSDGLSNELSEQEIRSALVAGNCQQASEDLLDMALQRGGRDNISVVVAHAEDLYSTEKTVLNPAL